jgi:hypothetical protein
MKCLLWLITIATALPLNCFETSFNMVGIQAGTKITSDLNTLLSYYDTNLKLSRI